MDCRTVANRMRVQPLLFQRGQYSRRLLDLLSQDEPHAKPRQGPCPMIAKDAFRTIGMDPVFFQVFTKETSGFWPQGTNA
jgi:hypothetical protein